MTDFNVALEVVLLLGVSFAPLAAGLALRRKFSPAAQEGAEPAVPTGAQKMGRLAGNFLFWGGILGILFMIVAGINMLGWI